MMIFKSTILHRTLHALVGVLSLVIMSSHVAAQGLPSLPGTDPAALNRPSTQPIRGSGGIVNPLAPSQPTPVITTTPSRPLPNVIDTTEDEIKRQSQGTFPNMARGSSVTAGSLQRAWDIPQPSSGQTTPGVIRYAWHPNLVMALRTREFMVTAIHLPEWERLTSIIIGDPVLFEAKQVKPNVIALRPNHAGGDTNITAIGLSGNVYSFYVRSESWNSEQISDFTVYVETGGSAARGGRGGNIFNAATGGPGNITDVIDQFPSFPVATPLNAAPGLGPITAQELTQNSLRSPTPPDYIREIAFNPENLQFDLKIYAENPLDSDIAPERVFHDGVWTYFDYGSKADTVRRPIVYAVVDGVDTLVNTRTAGPNGNIVVAETIGDFTLRNGNRVICIYTPRTWKMLESGELKKNRDKRLGEPAFPSTVVETSGRTLQEKPRGDFR